MTTTPDPVADLTAIRETWGDLLTAIATPPASVWPPRELHHTLHAVDDDEHPADDEPLRPHPQVGRLPLTLREHPAPLNLDALDAATETEVDLFCLADLIAGAVQPSMRTIDVSTYGDAYPGATIPDPRDADNPDRWHYPAPTSPGSRSYGLHWAAVWIEGVLAGTNALCRPVPEVIRDEAAQAVARCRARVERALGRDGRTITMEQPCPWCGGQLTARTTSGDPEQATVTCGTGPLCVAPTVYDERARRVWRGRDLVGLWSALDAKARRASA